jgi:hypothetical protein
MQVMPSMAKGIKTNRRLGRYRVFKGRIPLAPHLHSGRATRAMLAFDAARRAAKR